MYTLLIADEILIPFFGTKFGFKFPELEMKILTARSGGYGGYERNLS